MNYTEFEVGGKIYKLRLTVKSLMALEKQLGKNPLQVFMEIDEGNLPKLTEMVMILQAALASLNHGINVETAAELVEQYIMEGHNMFDLVPVLVGVFQDSGFVSADNGEAAETKN